MSKDLSLDDVNSNQRILTDEISEIIDRYLEDFASLYSLPQEITRHFPVFAQSIKSIIFCGKISVFQRCIENWLKEITDLQARQHNLTLKKFESLFKDFEWLFCTLAEDDEFEILNFLFEEKATANYILSVNPYVLWTREDSIDFFSYAVKYNALNIVHLLLAKNVYSVQFSHLMTAVEYHAEEVFEYLLTKFKPSGSEWEKLASRARSLGNVTILNYLKCSPAYYFDDLIQNYLETKDEIKLVDLNKAVRNSVARAYRLTLSIPEVKELCLGFITAVREKYSTQEELIKQIEFMMKQAGEGYLRWGILSPYRNPEHLQGLNRAYKYIEDPINKITFSPPPNLEGDNIEIEMKSGFQRRSLLDALLLKSDDFLSFDEIIDAVSKSFLPKNELETFGERRTSPIRGTPLTGRYATVVPYLTPLYKKNYHFKNSILKKDTYDFFYDGDELSGLEIILDNFRPGQRFFCDHGSCPLNRVLPKIQKLHQEIGLMDSKSIQKDPALFYQKIAQVLSLTGKLTIYRRGTGRLVETWLGYVHLKKGFSLIPILKKVQLDVLNIALPEEIEDKLLLYFFKFDSLSKEVQQYVTDLNKKPEINELLQEFKLGPYEKRIISDKGLPMILSDEKIINNFLNFSFIKSDSRDRAGENLLTWAVSQNQFNFARQIAATGKICPHKTLDSQGNSVYYKMLKMKVFSRISGVFSSFFDISSRPAYIKIKMGPGGPGVKS